MRNKGVFRIVICALFAALSCVATMVIQIPSPMQGYVNLGDCIVLLGAFVLGPVYGAVAGGVGSMLADLLLGYALYAPGTLVIKAIMGLVAGFLFLILKNKNKYAGLIVGGLAAEAVMVLGYFLYAMLLMGEGLAAAASIPGNLFQGAVGIIVSVILYIALEKSKVLKQIEKR